MSSDPQSNNSITRVLAAGWRALLVSYESANRITHHALGWLLITLVIFYFAFCAAFLSLRYLILPNIDHYQPEVEQLASHFLGRPVTINAIHADWSGLNPRLQLDNLIIYNQQGERALILPSVSATVSWWSAVTAQLRLDQLEILRPDLEIERNKDGKIFVGGIPIDIGKQDQGSGLDWLLAQHQIVIRDGWVRWRDALRDAPDLNLSRVSFVLQNQWLTHRAVLNATPPEELAAPIDVRAEFKHPAFAAHASDVNQWVGELFVDWRNTNLEAWKPYVTWPYKVAGGTGAIRSWLRFDHRIIVNVTADLDLENLSVQLSDELDPLKLVAVSGRVSAGEVASGLKEKIFSFGAHGYAITLSNFSLRTDQGEVLPSTTAHHFYTASRDGRDEHHELQITELDLEALSRLAGHLPLSLTERQMLADFAPRGQLHDFLASWDGNLPGAGKYRLSGKFAGLALRPQSEREASPTVVARSAVPGFEGLSGEIDATQEGGNAKLSGKGVVFYVSDILNNPTLSFEDLVLDANWSLRERNRLMMKIANMNFVQAGIKGSLEGSHSLPLPFNKNKLGEIDVQLHIPFLELTRVGGFLPAGIPQLTRDWISRALLDGQAQDVQLAVKGELDKFPFQSKRSGEKSTGVFKINARINDGTLNPAPFEFAQDKRTPLWTPIENIKGTLSLDQARIQVHADSARIAGVQISAVDAVIPDYVSPRAVLDLNGTANGSLQSMLNVVNSTPIAGWIDNITEESRATGNARVALQLQVPFTAGLHPTVQGNLRFQGNEVQLWRSLPSIQNTSGELSFSDHGFQINGVQGGFLGGNVLINGGTQKDGTVLTRLDGSVTVDGIARGLNVPSIRRLSKKISGGTRYSAMLRIKNQRPELTIDSSLVGVVLDLPAPLIKNMGDALPLRFAMSALNSADPTIQQEEIKINLGKSMSARYVRQRINARNAPWKLARGGIGVNLPPPQPENGVGININLPSVDIDAWRSTITILTGDQTAGAESSAGSMDYNSFVAPDMIGIRSNELILANRVLTNAVLGASRQRDGWQFNIHSDQANGHASWDDPWFERGAGKFTANFTSLIIPQSDASEVTELLSGKKTSRELPGLDVVADNFQLRGMSLGRLELSATNAGLGPGREWRISKLVIVNPDATLRATGKWQVFAADSLSTMIYEMEINDAGRMLDRIGFEKTLRGGKGRIEGEVSWRGSPDAFDFPSMNGNLSLKIASGQFLKADPGVAKLLNVMSLQSLPRRLTLDFRDIFSEGFAFDSMASTAVIARGVLKTDTFKMRGVNAVVLMDGTVDLNDETQNLNVVVIPELNAGGASVVYGLAINPVVGLGSFLAQLFLRSPLSQALTQEYQVTGPWKDPVVKKATSKRKLPAVEAEKPAQQ